MSKVARGSAAPCSGKPSIRSPAPTGVGFCLYIRRALLDDVGLFDAQRFSSGYGSCRPVALAVV
ncbi:MAG TPA: hypothetical protein VF505_00385 [Thermoanaerobaculia bacterium]